ncbi:MAG: adenylate kinase family protein [Candidatus Thermoplasmatota archaeon]|nr:adenylate kinase family protein [Candidatus Thermoplasmatota archaeon]
MKIALTGTPGVGKTRVSKVLERRGYETLGLNEFIKDMGLRGDKDHNRKTFEVDTEHLKEVYHREKPDFDIVEGHLAHHLSISPTVVLRCAPSELEERMKNKGWDRDKIEENIEAEMLDAILIEALDLCEDVYEIDTTSKDPKEVASEVEDVIDGEVKKYEPGSIDWSEEFLSRQ